MLKYILGILKNLFNPAVSLFALIDDKSVISRKAKVYGRVQVTYSAMGDYSYVGRGSRVIHADVGKFCSIAGDVKLGMGTHTLDKMSTSPIFTECHNSTGHQWTGHQIDYPYKRVKVGNDVWIGASAMIMGGISIGNGAVIGAGAIVTRDVPPYAIVAGVPAKIIRYRFSQEIIDKLIESQWWDMPESVLKDNIALFQDSHCEEAVEALLKI